MLTKSLFFLHIIADKIKFTAVRLSDTKWQYGGKYKITKTKENKFKCVSCGSMETRLDKVVAHIRSQHVELEGPEKVIHLQEKDTPSLNVASGEWFHSCVFY